MPVVCGMSEMRTQLHGEQKHNSEYAAKHGAAKNRLPIFFFHYYVALSALNKRKLPVIFD